MSGADRGFALRAVPDGFVERFVEPRQDDGSDSFPGLLDSIVNAPLSGLGSPGPSPTLVEHLTTYGPRPCRDQPGGELVDLLDAVAATGRGGAHFPLARKWRSVRAAVERTGLPPLVVANGAEGEPASAKDAILLTRRPHLVLDGLADAAAAVGARESVVWLHGDAHVAHRAVLHAVQERRAAGLVEAPVRLATGPSRYLSGESSAVVQGLSGGPALPTYRVAPTSERGVGGRPTLVQNVESLARAGLLTRTGLDDHRPTSLLTVLVDGRRVVLEVEVTRTVGAAVAAAVAAVGPADCIEPPQAVLMGGYGGAWLPWAQVSELPLHEPSMRAAGTSLGSGVLAVLPAGACGVAETARVAAYLADAGARQCGPCLFGLPALAGALEELRRGGGRRAGVRRLVSWSAEIQGRGACHHPDGAVRMVLSALTTFADDVDLHRRGRPCAGWDRPPLLPVPREEL